LVSCKDSSINTDQLVPHVSFIFEPVTLHDFDTTLVSLKGWMAGMLSFGKVISGLDVIFRMEA
jgi:hypothetical protein